MLFSLSSLSYPKYFLFCWRRIENKLVCTWLHKFDGEKKILIDPIATLSEHHVSDNDKGYATLDCFIFMDSFGAQNLATNGTQIPYCNGAQDDDWSYNQPVDGDEKAFMCLVDYDRRWDQHLRNVLCPNKSTCLARCKAMRPSLAFTLFGLKCEQRSLGLTWLQFWGVFIRLKQSLRHETS